MIKTKIVFKKILVSLLIILTLFNFISSTNTDMSNVYATPDPPSNKVSNTTVTPDDDRVGGLLDSIISGITGAIINFVKWIVIAPIRAMRNLNFTLASAGGTTKDLEKNEITPFEIFFNKFTLLDANIFSTTDRDGEELDQDSIVYKIRNNTSIWYYAVRALAIEIVAIMLLLNLIKALSKNTTAEKKVVAKNAVVDWVLSFALIMFMHIIIIMVLNFNDVILKVFQGSTEVPELTSFIDSLENVIFSDNLTLSIASIVVYALLEYQTFKYILVYVQRLLTIVLLIIISPIVPVTYSTDRMRGGRGAALNSWLKELVYNVFIQSVHALVYCAFVGFTMNELTNVTVATTDDLGLALVAVASMLFVKYAEKIVKTIFGFNNSQILNTNIFSDTANVVKSVGRAAVRAPIRAAQGGPLISFGKNVDGSDIGIGQIANGMKNSAAKTWDGVKGAGIKVKDTAIGIGNKAKDTAVGIGNKAVDIGTKVRDADIGEIARNAGGRVRDGATYAKDGIKGIGTRAVDGARGFYEGLTGQSNQSIREEESQEKLEEAIKEVSKNSDEEVKEKLEEDKKERQKEEKQDKSKKPDITEVEQVNEKNNETHEETVERINTKEIEENETEIENVEENDDKEADDKEVGLIIPNINKEGLEKVKGELKELFNSYNLKLDAASGNIKINDEKSKEVGKNLDDDTREAIEDTLVKDSQVNNDDFIDTLEGDEREYALYYDKMLKSLKQYDSLQREREESLEGLAKTREVDFSGTNQSISSLISNGDIDKLTVENDNKDGAEKEQHGANITMNQASDENVNRVNLSNNVENLESERQGKVESIDSVRMKAETKRATKDLSKLGMKIHGKSEGEIQTEIQEDFDSRIEETEKKYGTGNLSEIAKKMSDQAKQQLKDYKSNKITEKDLGDEARSLAILERQARYLGYEMEVGNLNTGNSEQKGDVKIEARIDDGPTKEYTGETVSQATGEVVRDLSQKRQEKVVSLSERRAQRNSDKNSNNQKYA